MRPLELVSMAQNGHTQIAAGSKIQEAEHSYWWSTNPVLFFSRTAVAALVSAAAGTLWSVLQLLTLFEHEQLPRLGADA